MTGLRWADQKAHHLARHLEQHLVHHSAHWMESWKDDYLVPPKAPPKVDHWGHMSDDRSVGHSAHPTVHHSEFY